MVVVECSQVIGGIVSCMSTYGLVPVASHSRVVTLPYMAISIRTNPTPCQLARLASIIVT